MSRPSDQPPLANPSKTIVSRLSTKATFVNSSRDILSDARRRFPQQPFRLRTDWGNVLVLPPTFADELRNDSRLSFGKAAMQDNHAGVPGFETVQVVGRDDRLVQRVARKQLTKHLV
ncbi:hypothetical protein E4U12_006980 [Claviceps purpurea]|nr:hypothetical protein E4U12_006980 [Claviceps purpurea]